MSNSAATAAIMLNGSRVSLNSHRSVNLNSLKTCDMIRKTLTCAVKSSLIFCTQKTAH